MDRYLPVTEKQVEELSGAIEEVQDLLREKLGPAESGELSERLDEALSRLLVFPLEPLQKQFQALVSETAAHLRKEAEWLAEGFALEVPGPLREAISAIGLHAIRNALDHGIELPSQRRALGKPSAGKIRAALTLDAGWLKLCVQDDGRGPDLKAIAERAVEAGFLTEDEAIRCPSQRLFQLLFRAGFSTRSEASAISGRGVGLDAVLAAAEDLGGTAIAGVAPTKGFELNVTLPVFAVGLMAVPMRMGDWVFWLPETAVVSSDQEAFSSLNAEELLHARVFARSVGAELPEKPALAQIRSDRPGEPALIVAASEVGVAQRRVFRKLDPSWIGVGPSWFKAWFDACDGWPLACRSTGTGPERFSMLATYSLLSRMTGAE